MNGNTERFTLPEGDYRVFVSHGLEWSLAELGVRALDLLAEGIELGVATDHNQIGASTQASHRSPKARTETRTRRDRPATCREHRLPRPGRAGREPETAEREHGRETTRDRNQGAADSKQAASSCSAPKRKLPASSSRLRKIALGSAAVSCRSVPIANNSSARRSSRWRCAAERTSPSIVP